MRLRFKDLGRSPYSERKEKIVLARGPFKLWRYDRGMCSRPDWLVSVTFPHSEPKWWDMPSKKRAAEFIEEAIASCREDS